MTCDAFRAAHLAGARSPATDAHLHGCGACRRALGDLDEVAARLADPAVWEEPDPGLLARVAEALGEHTGRPATARRRLPRRRWAVAAATAAAVVVAVVATAQVGRGEAPDWRVALVPTAAAPGAVATVAGWVEDSGTRMELEVEGLPPASGGGHYALWLTAPDGRHVSAGTFTASGTLVTWAGASRAEFPRLWVTLEPDDGDETLSGTSVLDMPG